DDVLEHAGPALLVEDGARILDHDRGSDDRVERCGDRETYDGRDDVDRALGHTNARGHGNLVAQLAGNVVGSRPEVGVIAAPELRGVIGLRVPGAIAYRHLAIRLVSTACKMALGSNVDDDETEFEPEVVSAF